MGSRGLSIATMLAVLGLAASPCLAQTYSMCHYDTQGRLVRAEKSNGISFSYRYDQEDAQPRKLRKTNMAGQASAEHKAQVASGCQVRVKRSSMPVQPPTPN